MEAYKYNNTDFILMMNAITDNKIDHYLFIKDGFNGYDNWIEYLRKDYVAYATTFLIKNSRINLSSKEDSFSFFTEAPLSEMLLKLFKNKEWTPFKNLITDKNEIIFTGKGHIFNIKENKNERTD